jgi:hypothetical protein
MICQICGNRETEPEHLEVCRVCMGLEKADEKEALKEETTLMAGYKCKVCGDANIANFYPSVQGYCKKCHTAKTKEWAQKRKQEREQKSIAPVADAPSDITQDAELATSPLISVMQICKECGSEFESYRHGAISDMKICKQCLDRKMRAGEASRLRRIVESKDRPLVVIDFSGDEVMLDGIRRTAARERRTVEAQILYWLSSHTTEVEVTYV